MNFSNKDLLNNSGRDISDGFIVLVIITGATFELGNSKNPFSIPHLI